MDEKQGEKEDRHKPPNPEGNAETHRVETEIREESEVLGPQPEETGAIAVETETRTEEIVEDGGLTSRKERVVHTGGVFNPRNWDWPKQAKWATREWIWKNDPRQKKAGIAFIAVLTLIVLGALVAIVGNNIREVREGRSVMESVPLVIPEVPNAADVEPSPPRPFFPSTDENGRERRTLEDDQGVIAEVAPQPAPPPPVPEPLVTEVAPPPVTASPRHVVVIGDTLTGIASDHRCYSVWREIPALNSSIANPDLIYAGQEIVLPPKCLATGVTEMPEAPRVTAVEPRSVPQAPFQEFASRSGEDRPGGFTLWKNYGDNPLGCDVSIEEALSRFPNLSDEERKEFARLHENGEGRIVSMKRGMEIGDMLGGRGRTYPNAKIDFEPDSGDVMMVYIIERYEGSGTERRRIRKTLSMPTECCNYALKVDEESDPGPDPPAERTVSPPETREPPLMRRPCDPDYPGKGPLCPRSPTQARPSPRCVPGQYVPDPSRDEAACPSASEPNSGPSFNRGGRTQYIPGDVGAHRAQPQWIPFPEREREGAKALRRGRGPKDVASFQFMGSFSPDGKRPSIDTLCSEIADLQVGTYRCPSRGE